DRAGGHVVALRVPGDLASAGHHEGDLGLGHVDGGVLADRYRLAVAGHPPGRGLEEDLRPLRVVDPLVDVGRPLAFLAAGLPGDLVRDAAGPDLGPAVHRRQDRDVRQVALRAAGVPGPGPDL